MNTGQNAVLALLQRTLLSRASASLVGLIALAALIWYAGAWFGLSVAQRLYLIGAIIVLALCVYAVRWLMTRRRGARLQAELQSQDDGRGAEREAEIASIRAKMDEAIASLRASELGARYRGRAALYALPWYMIIGPSAAGKSTLLRQSGLHFPYANADDLHLRGFGGTRNCDWWFSDQAILLDTAGRYTTEEDDREEWLTFLDLLRRNRPRMPINGVLVCISISDLLTADSAGLERHVKILRERIDELMRRLGLVFPVYVVFTKCDLIHGFEAFFEDLSEHERKQVWGAYLLDDEGGDPAALFETKMRALYAKLCELRLRKVSMQRNLARKALLFDFPHQFAAATEKLTEFVHLLCRPNPYQETPRFAGAYFTSGTQEGTPLQRLVGSLRQAFGFASEPVPRTGQPKAFFIRNLFTDVIFQLQSLVHGNRRRVIVQRWLKSASLVGSFALLTGTALLLSGTYAVNGLLLDRGTAAVASLREAVAAEQAEPLRQYRALARVFDQYQALLAHQRSRPLVSYVGVYTGHRQIEALERLLDLGMESLFRDRIFRSLEHRLENFARQWATADDDGREHLREEYYQALKVYLMTVREPGRLDVEYAGALLSDLWARQLAFANADQSYTEVQAQAPQLGALVGFYLRRADTTQWPARNDLIAQAQAQLHTPPNAEQLYNQIAAKGRLQFPARGVDALLSGQNQGVLVSDSRIPGIYSARAWNSYVRAEIAQAIEAATRGDWVLSLSAETDQQAIDDGDQIVDRELAEQLELALRERYFRDYADAWLAFMQTVSPRRFESLQDATAKLMLLARSDGLIGELMQAVANNINLNEVEPLRLREAGGLGERLGDALAARNRVPELDVRLADLRRFTNPAEQKSVSELINQYLLVLSGLKNEVERLAAAIDVQREAQAFAANVLGSGSSNTEIYKGWVTANSLLNGTDVRTREALQPLLMNSLRYVWAAVLEEARQQLQHDWQNVVVSVYRQQIDGKFPFAPAGPDAALSDVAEFFRPDDGVLWAFVEQTLAPFLVEQRQGWQERRWLNMGLGFNRSFLRSLSEARLISQSLFRRGSANPELVFYAYPLPAQGMAEMVLESNGQVYRYRNEPQEWRRFLWPGEADQIGARVAGLSTAQVRAELRASGQWGLFHLLKDARLTSEGGTVYLAEWQLESEGMRPLTVRYRLRADRQHSVFRQSMTGFRLPTVLFSTSEVATGGR